MSDADAYGYGSGSTSAVPVPFTPMPSDYKVITPPREIVKIAPVDPKVFLQRIIDPACIALTGIMNRDMGDDRARSLELAIALQETRLRTRLQVGEGGKFLRQHGRGWWQFEAGGAVKGVMTHPVSKIAAQAVCQLCYVPFNQRDVHEAIAWHDHLAASFARLLLWTDAAPLPEVGDEDASWEYYRRIWNPGKPHPASWPKLYATAVATVNDERMQSISQAKGAAL